MLELAQSLFGGLLGKAAEGISYIVLLKIVLNWLGEHPGLFLVIAAPAFFGYMAWRHGQNNAKDSFRFNPRSLNQIVTALLTLGLFALGVANVFGWVSFNASDRKVGTVPAPYAAPTGKQSLQVRPSREIPDPFEHLNVTTP